MNYYVNKKFNGNIEESLIKIIDIDVKRSFTQEKNFPRKKLVNILRTTTYIMKDTLGYCQGMNYLAGYFLKTISVNEQIAYQYYLTFVKNRMQNIFGNDFNQLQIYFYILDNLIKMYLPLLDVHFREIQMQSVFYASSWFITIFTCALQYTHKSYLVN